MKNQRGVSILGIIFWGGLLAVVSLCGVKMMPAYFEHTQVKHSLHSLKDVENIAYMSKPKIQDRLLRSFQINSINNVSHKLLEVEKSNDKVKLSLAYEVRVHLIGNIDALIKFNEEVMVE